MKPHMHEARPNPDHLEIAQTRISEEKIKNPTDPTNPSDPTDLKPNKERYKVSFYLLVNGAVLLENRGFR
jgi:hypothetical protein